MNIVQKIISNHLVAGTMTPGSLIGITIDQTLTQDATGTMAYLEFEVMDVPRVKTKLSVSYVDHNTLQTGFENADDHRFLQSIAAKYGIYFSRPGNGICHQVHLERFGQPGMTLLGSDSHTPTAGGLGMLAIGAGGLDVACALAGQPFYVTMPRVINVRLHGSLPAWVNAKDIILSLLRHFTVQGGVGCVFEYSGSGVSSLSVPQRATITNMGAELGATSSVFPSDERTKDFLQRQQREKQWIPITADSAAVYDQTYDLDCTPLVPLCACPDSPDNVTEAASLQDVMLSQVAVGSCTNSSYSDIMMLAGILKGKKVHPSVNLGVSIGSRQVYEMVARNGALADLIASGARILECTCGPCIGMGQAPASGTATLRSFNRNFKGRSGTQDAKTFLASVEVCAASAITGHITDPRMLGQQIVVREPAAYLIDDSMIIPPSEHPETVEIIRGPNIAPLPKARPLSADLSGKVLLKVGDDITTDHIMPAGAKVLPYRSNIPKMAEFVFSGIDPDFWKRAKQYYGGFIVAGKNYGQGSSREHAALAPLYLGIKAVIAQSFARIHRSNLINFGIVPLILCEVSDYEGILQNDELSLAGIRDAVKEGKDTVLLTNITQHKESAVQLSLNERERELILTGGVLSRERS